MLLDQHFMVVLNGNQTVIEAIAENGFSLSHPDLVWMFHFGREDHGRDLPYDLIEALCNGACLTAFVAVGCYSVRQDHLAQYQRLLSL